MRVLFVASECVPFVKTGGLADVVGALPLALARHDIDVKVMLPGYPAVVDALGTDAKTVLEDDVIGDGARLRAARASGIDVIAYDSPKRFSRPGNLYLGADGKDWPDNTRRFGAFAEAAAHLAITGAPLLGQDDWRPDILHAHDWQAGLAPAHLALSGEDRPSTVMTVHNIVFQGLFPPSELGVLGLPPEAFTADGLEYYGKGSMLKAGLVYSDAITTVSPSYANELTTPEYGMGLDGVIASRRSDVAGILNGVDTDIWNPETDPLIPQTYSVRSLKRKAANRAALAGEFGVETNPDAPLFCVVSRLTRQKGLDLLLEALPRLLRRGARLVVLGSGESDLEDAYRAAAGNHPDQVGVVIGYDEALSHRIQAGADAIVIPSRFEPCGLTQLYGLRYGTLPIVARTGGLADTVIDANDAALKAGVATGFQFSPVTVSALGDALERTCDLFADNKVWKSMVRRAMKHPVGWDESALAYVDLYSRLVSKPASP